MKKFFVLLCFFLFLSCSNEGFESKIVASAQGRVNCKISANQCVENISESVCEEIGEPVNLATCRELNGSSGVDLSSSSDNSSSSNALNSSSSNTLNSSSSGASSSSSSGTVSSSSSYVVSSSSINNSSSSSGGVAPIVSGNFEFRNFDDNVNKVYFLQKSMHVSSTPTGTSQLYNSLSISNATVAQCGAITIEIAGGGLIAIDSEPNHNLTTEPGTITATAVATCNGTKTELKTATAEVIADPIISDCNLPSTYLHKADTLTDLVLITGDNLGRCSAKYDVVTYTPQTPSVSKPVVGAILPLTNYSGKTITVRAQIECTGAQTVEKRCAAASVSENYIKFDHNDDPKYTLSKNSSTVIEFLTTDLPTGLGCEYKESSTTPISFSYNGIDCNDNKSYWTECNFSSSDIYTTNGNRILFKTTLNQDLLCTTFVK